MVGGDIASFFFWTELDGFQSPVRASYESSAGEHISWRVLSGWACRIEEYLEILQGFLVHHSELEGRFGSEQCEGAGCPGAKFSRRVGEGTLHHGFPFTFYFENPSFCLQVRLYVHRLEEIDFDGLGQNQGLQKIDSGPTHDLVQYGGYDASMNQPVPSRQVFRNIDEGTERMFVGEEGHVQPGRIDRAAAETPVVAPHGQHLESVILFRAYHDFDLSFLQKIERSTVLHLGTLCNVITPADEGVLV